MGLCDERPPPHRRIDEQQPDIVFDDVSDIDDDAEPQAAPAIEYEDISDASTVS